MYLSKKKPFDAWDLFDIFLIEFIFLQRNFFDEYK